MVNIYLAIIFFFNYKLITKIKDENEDNKKFWQILNCKIGDVKDESDVSDIEFEVDFKSSKISLFKFVLASFKF